MKVRTIICTLVAIIAIGCTIRDEVFISHPKRMVDYREYIDSVISENYGCFGDVLILDSLEEAYELLEYWSTLSYTELRADYSQYGFYSTAIESHITYDSLFHIYMERYGLEEDSEYEVPSIMLSEFQSDIFQDYSDIIPPQYIYDQDLGSEIIVVEPIGDFNLYALANEHGIFIADSIVYKIASNGQLISFSISDYPQYSGYSYEAILSILNSGENDDLIPDLPLVYYYEYDHYRNEPLFPSYEKVAYSNDQMYRMKASLHACARYSRFYGTTTLFTEFKLKNYKASSLGLVYFLTKLHTSGAYSYTYEAYHPNDPHDIQNQYGSDVDAFCRRYFNRHIIARYAYNDFAYPECGFINCSFDLTNGQVVISPEN